MKIIVTGVKGQLGYDVVKELESRHYTELLGIDINDLDITDQKAVNEFMDIHKPNVIIHCAAYTAVDKAEDNKDLCMNVNVVGTKFLVEAAKIYDAKFVYISTDYVFDGTKESSYCVTDSPNPKSVYGESKYLGELETLKCRKYFIVRISWVFGKNGNNFVKTILRLAKEKKSLAVVSDQFGSPTYTYDLSRLLVDMIETEKYGIYHATNEGECNWYDFTKEIFNLAEIRIPLKSITTEQYPTKAKRPMNSVMCKDKLDANGFKRLPHWKDALKRYLKEIEVL
ncbi:MAG: dTDP-4-dehydrorhamnose reductase [Firmicutes bacterium]|nr:dTDP-4-dehydrorhamnose reductase [Bacillota bacterium]